MYDWTYLDGTGSELGRSTGFDEEADAEDWMGRSWQDLVANGVEEVELIDRTRERRLYRMGLATE
jgi:hypothetical protein